MSDEEKYRQLEDKIHEISKDLSNTKSEIRALELKMTKEEYKVAKGSIVKFDNELYKVHEIRPRWKHKVGFARPHLLVLSKKKDGKWGKAIKTLYEFNSKQWEVVTR